MDYIFYQSVIVWHRHLGADQILTDFYVSAILSGKEGNRCLYVKIRKSYKIAE